MVVWLNELAILSVSFPQPCMGFFPLVFLERNRCLDEYWDLCLGGV